MAVETAEEAVVAVAVAVVETAAMVVVVMAAVGLEIAAVEVVVAAGVVVPTTIYNSGKPCGSTCWKTRRSIQSC